MTLRGHTVSSEHPATASTSGLWGTGRSLYLDRVVNASAEDFTVDPVTNSQLLSRTVSHIRLKALNTKNTHQPEMSALS
jgi:hypothetical protein